MENKEILDKIKPVFIEVLGHDNFELNESSTTNDIDGWDSLSHMMIIGEVEKVYNIKFKLFDLMTMHNVGDLIKSINKNIS
ncbi:acyl carrier protein [Cellulophaga sp. Hel_I_12]|uniref:acyl carrier protein n=1 Tax=Cellulophaga sp. Hel_I_12 TaxID=1249972 RepID=UPI000645AFC6|nr:acyl carrier protein [Cellulophaga sp. Hel_I_12]